MSWRWGNKTTPSNKVSIIKKSNESFLDYMVRLKRGGIDLHAINKLWVRQIGNRPPIYNLNSKDEFDKIIDTFIDVKKRSCSSPKENINIIPYVKPTRYAYRFYTGGILKDS